MVKIDKPPFMFGAYVVDVSSSISWSGQGGSCQLTLVEDPKNGITIKLPKVGTACYFRYKSFVFGGVFQRWSYRENINGWTYDIILESPGSKLLEGVNVILSGFEGTGFNEGPGYDKFNPSSNPSFTNELNNIYNPFGMKENYSFGGRWGLSNTNSAGFPALELLDLIEQISRGESVFGGPMVFGESEYEIDLEEIKIVPEYFRIGGQTLTLNAIINECADLMQFDFFPEIRSISGIPEEDGGGVLEEPLIKIRTIPKQEQPEPGRIARFIQEAKAKGNVVSSDVGQELSDVVTQKLVIGAPASRYFVANIDKCIPVWGKTAQNSYIVSEGFAPTPIAYRPESKVTVLLDEYDPSSIYIATVLELRFALGGQENWIAYKVFESYYKGTQNEDPWCFLMEPDFQTLERLAAGLVGPLALAATSMTNAPKAYNNIIKEYVTKIYNAVSKVANQFYGQYFLIPLPVEPGGLLNNLKFVREEVDEVPSWEIADSAWVTYKPIRDIAFYDMNGRLKSVAVYPFSSRFDYGAMGGDYAIWSAPGFGTGLCTSKSGPDNGKIIFVAELPYVVFNAGVQIFNFDEFTTPDFGITFLAKYFFNIDLPPERYITPGKAITIVKVPPVPAPPEYIGVPQESQRYAWGPWYGFGTKNGKSEVVFDTSLAPETFGSVDTMNQAGIAYATAGNAVVTANETGYVELAEYPEYNLADRFAGSGPYITNMNISISISGFTTKYQFNTWTPNFGKLAKFNADRISRIYKSAIKALKEIRDNRPKRPFSPLKFESSNPEDLAKRFQRTVNASFLSGLSSIISNNNSVNTLGNIPVNTSNKYIELNQINIGDAAANSFNKYKNSYGCTLEQTWSIYSTQKTKSQNDPRPGIMIPDIQELLPYEYGNKFIRYPDQDVGFSVFPTCIELDPYFPYNTAEEDDDGSEFISRSDYLAVINDVDGATPNDLQIKKITNNKNIDAIRSVAIRGPIVVSGWGYDLANNPAPHIDNDITKFDTELVNDRSKWKTGPVRLLWDEERQIWSGGLEFLSGRLVTPITAPNDILAPTTFSIEVLYKVNKDKGAPGLEFKGKTIVCFNRDPSLEQPVCDGKVYVMVMRINYEWIPIWVGCPCNAPNVDPDVDDPDDPPGGNGNNGGDSDGDGDAGL